ncbi:class I SAM-dependent methyltransferase [Paenibacillus wenxiniae]|uniref:Class I SAM-dependent methyltransferase n=1 Tax=Paenibacillus wenxiniae TaxID=1636843 RepID=A0ABW4RQ54_9BACL
MITKNECFTYKEFVDKYQSYLYPMLGAHISRLYNRQGGIIIDMGTGPGYLSSELVERTGGKVHAVDINPAMHELTSLLLKKKNIEHMVSCDIVDVHNQHYPDDYADLIVSYSCLHHWEDPVKGLAECYRVLAQGGLMIILDTLPNDKKTLQALERSIVEPEYFRFVREAFEESYSFEQIEAFVEQAGISAYELKQFNFSEEDMIDCLEILEELVIPEVDEDANAKSWILIVRK